MPTRRTALFRSTAFLQHDTGNHPERASRIAAIERELERRGLLVERVDIPFGFATDEQILAAHEQSLLDGLDAVAASGGGWIDQDTVVRRESPDIARLAAGAAVAAVDALLAGTVDRAMVLARPPGHHATATRAMGFCLLNTVAIAAAHALARGAERVAILDWDVHHGNGTQDIFYARGDVLYCSLHQSPLFPGTGDARETGRGPGEGFTVNVPLPAGTAGEAFLTAYRERVKPAIDTYAPDLVLVSAGYDAHEQDPIGGMRLTDETYRDLAREAIELAHRWSGDRLGVILEGGYHAGALARSVAGTIEVLDEE